MPREGIGGKGTFVDEVGPRTGLLKAKHHLLMLSLSLSLCVQTMKKAVEKAPPGQRRKERLTK